MLYCVSSLSVDREKQLSESSKKILCSLPQRWNALFASPLPHTHALPPSFFCTLVRILGLVRRLFLEICYLLSFETFLGSGFLSFLLFLICLCLAPGFIHLRRSVLLFLSLWCCWYTLLCSMALCCAWIGSSRLYRIVLFCGVPQSALLILPPPLTP